jgi:hypothetical protein
MKITVYDLGRLWSLPGRALNFGLSMTFAGSVVLGHFLFSLPWRPAFCLGVTPEATPSVKNQKFIEPD